MRHVTADTVNQDNETYRRFLEPNGWVLKEGDVLYNSFIKTSKNVGTTTGNTTFNLMAKDGSSTIYIVAPDLKGCESITIDPSNDNSPWHVPGFSVRMLAEEQFVFKKNPAYGYAGLRLAMPEKFDINFESVQVPSKPGKPSLLLDVEGTLKGHNIQLNADGTNVECIFKGWGTKNGGFSGLRALEEAKAQIVSGEISNFTIAGTISEGIYIGVRLIPHAVFKNFRLANGLFINCGTEFLQAENFGEGCITEDLTVINSATQAISPFQNWQRGTLQYKAGQGSSKIRRIYIQGYGDKVFNPVSDGLRAGDTVEVSDIYATNGDGCFMYINQSCNSGAKWIFNNIHFGGASKRIGIETKSEVPYAIFDDVHPDVRDQFIFKSITTDKTLPLFRNKSQYITVENHNVVEEVPRAKFVNPSFPFGTKVLGYYSKYNEVSQKQFYPVAGQPAKYSHGDIVYWDKGGVRTWYKLTQDQLGSTSGPVGDLINDPGEHFEQAPDSPLLNVAGFPQAQQSEPTKDEIIMALSTQLQEMAAQAAELEAKNAELTTRNADLETANSELTAKQGQITAAATQLIASANELINLTK